MRRTTKRVVVDIGLIGLTLGAALALAYHTPRSQRQPLPPKDSFRYIPVENREIFRTMGAFVLKVHVPAGQLIGQKSVVLRTQMPGRPVMKLSGRLNESRSPGSPLDVNFTVKFDDISYTKAERIAVSIFSDEFYNGTAYGPKIPNVPFNGIGVPHDVGDIRQGVELLQIFGYDHRVDLDRGTITFTLWAE